MPDPPLEVCLGVSLDEGVDRAHTAVGLGGVVGGGLMVLRLRGCVPGSVSPHSVSWMVGLSLKFEHWSEKYKLIVV